MGREFFRAIELEVAFIKWVIQQPSYGYDTTREGFKRIGGLIWDYAAFPLKN